MTQPHIQEDALQALREKFARLIPRLGANNTRGTLRHSLEVDFMYALNEYQNCPPYLAGKMFDDLSNVCNSLVLILRERDNSRGQEATA